VSATLAIDADRGNVLGGMLGEGLGDGGEHAGLIHEGAGDEAQNKAVLAGVGVAAKPDDADEVGSMDVYGAYGCAGKDVVLAQLLHDAKLGQDGFGGRIIGDGDGLVGQGVGAEATHADKANRDEATGKASSSSSPGKGLAA